MLRLVGAKADGWLPSLSLPEAGRPGVRQRIIDEAAEEAGRDPREIRRLLNVFGDPSRSAEQWVEQLLPLVLENGVGTFILGSDDPV